MKMQYNSLNETTLATAKANLARAEDELSLAIAKANLARAEDELAKAQDILVARHREVQAAAHRLARFEKQRVPDVKRVVKTIPDKQSALTNLVYVNETDEIARYAFIEAGEFVFTVGIHPHIFAGCLGLGNLQRKILRVATYDEINFRPYLPKSVPDITMLYIEIANFAENNLIECELNVDELIACFIRGFKGQIFSRSQIVAFEHNGINYRFTVSNLMAGTSQEVSRGLLRENTTFIFTNTDQNPIKIQKR